MQLSASAIWIESMLSVVARVWLITSDVEAVSTYVAIRKAGTRNQETTEQHLTTFNAGLEPDFTARIRGLAAASVKERSHDSPSRGPQSKGYHGLGAGQ